MYMLYFLAAILILVGIILSLRLRVRFVLGSEDQLLFVGLGRTGVDLNFSEKSGRIKLAGIGIKKLSLAKSEPKPGKKEKAEKAKTKKRVPRRRDWKAAVRLLPRVSSAVFVYFVSILRSLIVEELKADIKGGFDSPDITGAAYGYYQAALAAVPGVVSRVQYQPDWTGASFNATAKGSVALPVYKLLYHSMRALCALPLRELVKLAIGKKRGGQDG